MNHQFTPICSGEAAAPTAGSHDSCRCSDCRLMFPGGELYALAHGNVCESCLEERIDRGLDQSASETENQ